MAESQHGTPCPARKRKTAVATPTAHCGDRSRKHVHPPAILSLLTRPQKSWSSNGAKPVRGPKGLEERCKWVTTGGVGLGAWHTYMYVRHGLSTKNGEVSDTS